VRNVVKLETSSKTLTFTRNLVYNINILQEGVDVMSKFLKNYFAENRDVPAVNLVDSANSTLWSLIFTLIFIIAIPVLSFIPVAFFITHLVLTFAFYKQYKEKYSNPSP
jgi:hypothetical protein